MRYTKEWSQYDHYYGYDKAEYDIILFDGRVVFNCYPNAGIFNSFNLDTKGQYSESEVKQIRLSKNEELFIN